MMRFTFLGLFAALLCSAQEGSQVFISHCLQCHSSTSTSHAPTPEALAQIPWQDVLKTLETGEMKVEAQNLSTEEKTAVARFVGKAAGPQVLTEVSGFCAEGAKPAASGGSWNGWGVDELNTRFQPAAAAGITAADVPSLKVKWAFGYPNGRTAYGQPNVVGGRVYTGSNDGTIYAIDAHSGCLYWRYRAKALVRSGVVVGPDKRAYVGDLDANLYALDADTGKLIWQKKVDSQPFARITGTPKLHNGRLYVPIASQEENAGANPIYPCCKFRGNLVALDAKTGTEIWRAYTSPEPQPTTVSKTGVQFYGPSGATIWSSPTIDLKRNLIYVTTGNGYSDPDIKTADALVAIDLKTGKIRWSQQATPDMFNWDCGPRGGGGNCPVNHGPDEDFGSSAVLLDVGRGRQLLVAGQKTGVVHAFDPDQNGKIVWQTRIGQGSTLGGVLWGIAGHKGVAYVPLSDMDRRKPESGGGMFALDGATGKVLWKTPPPKPACLARPGCTAAQLAPPSLIEGVVFAGAMDGHLRGYDMASGKIIWDFDATQSFPTTDGIKANGGSFSSTGPTIANGMVYVNSGYGGQGMAGNVLLAFSAR
ncbi:MAG TPA: PQQ-binding-like beta-propeller repeat protein [Bryobacteraceae bacterium]|nr:PQQ-binding-like beta-propeller repeat protein [Bryobacteraceae bacterium]